ncbi:peptidoglycan-binding protein [Spirosoma sp. BT702]|uniref:Peptidoglycan-binding protein n=1 Tax=Spirosoma profusum TaxID=2771354 RepID=A0A926Y3S0_9BACT|nr:peptidoglycan-binding domain-containing protein [Spirosoma profusum]MBD2702185.1 peptidoglycan-binding protein [Spirosoma profusum]
MATGEDVVKIAAKRVGERYIYGALAPKDNPNWRGPWDCAEYVSWCVFQAAQKLYGCDNNWGNPTTANAYTGYWRRDVANTGIQVSVELAAKTVGGILLRYPIERPRLDGHIVICDGKGGTYEAHSPAKGVINGKVTGRRWDTGVLVPDLEYTQLAGTIIVTPPTLVFRLTNPLMQGKTVREIQKKLKALDLNPGDIDGKYGPHTIAAVVAFQRLQGLVADGEVGEETATALGIDMP